MAPFSVDSNCETIIPLWFQLYCTKQVEQKVNKQCLIVSGKESILEALSRHSEHLSVGWFHGLKGVLSKESFWFKNVVLCCLARIVTVQMQVIKLGPISEALETLPCCPKHMLHLGHIVGNQQLGANFIVKLWKTINKNQSQFDADRWFPTISYFSRELISRFLDQPFCWSTIYNIWKNNRCVSRVFSFILKWFSFA